MEWYEMRVITEFGDISSYYRIREKGVRNENEK